jgi:hypothetical protein
MDTNIHGHENFKSHNLRAYLLGVLLTVLLKLIYAVPLEILSEFRLNAVLRTAQ